MEENKNNCAHCHGEGTCKSGNDGVSCEVCLRKGLPFYCFRFLFKNERKKGVICSVCEGSGDPLVKTKRLHEWLVPYLALFIVGAVIMLIVEFKESEHFNEVLAFCTTLIGSITGYYFRGVVDQRCSNKAIKKDV